MRAVEEATVRDGTSRRRRGNNRDEVGKERKGRGGRETVENSQVAKCQHFLIRASTKT